MKTKLRIYRLADVVEALKAKAKGDDKTMDLFGLMGASAPKVAPAPPAQPAAPAAADPREAKREELHRLRQEVAVPDAVFMPAGWSPAAHRQKHAEALAKIDRLEEDLGLKTWQRTPSEAQSAVGMPVAKHRQAVAAALKEGKPVPVHVIDAHPGVEHEAGRGDAAAQVEPAPASAPGPAPASAPQPTPPPPTHAPDDPTHGGRLHQEHRIDKHGREQTRWVTAPGFDPQVHLAQHADDVSRMKWHQVADAFEAVDSHEQVHALAAHILKNRPDLESDVDQAIGETVERLARDSALTEPPAGETPEPEAIEEAPPAPPAVTPEPVAPAPKKPAAERAPRAPDKIESVGEHVARARRDVAQERMQNRDIASMTEAERLKFITKANLIPEVTREQAEAMGKTPGWYEMRKAVVSAIGPSFEGGDDVARKYGFESAAAEYARMIDHVCKTLDACKSANDVVDAVNEMAQYVKGKSRLPGVYTNGAEAARASSEAWTQAGIYNSGSDWEHVSDIGVRGAYHQARYYAFGPATERDAGRRMFPVATLGVKFANLMGPSHKRGPGWKSALTRADRLEREGWTQKPAPAAQDDEATDKGEKKERKPWRQSVSELPERHGGRPVEKPDPVKFAQDFGLAEVDFGNYANQDDRRFHLQRCHEAMFDLAEVVGIEPGQLSLGSLSKRSSGDTQPLSIAFGARGKGRAAAHYEAGSVDMKGRPAPIINLTKFQGGGTLAHEWGHFLDNMLARAHRPAGVKFEFDHFASKGHTGTLPAPVTEAIDGVMVAMRGEGERHKRRIAEINEKYNAARSRGDRTESRAHADALGRAYADAARAKPTAFFVHAKTLDGSKNPEKAGYWATPHEMFARAFEAYVQDKVEDGGRRSSYLVDGTRVEYETGKSVGPTTTDESHPSVKAARQAHAEAAARFAPHEATWRQIVSKHTLSAASPKIASNLASTEFRAHPDFQAYLKARADVEQARLTLEKTAERHQVITDHAQPYPRGEERKAINAAFDRFFETLRAHPEVYKAVLAHMARPIPPGARLQVLRLRGAGRG